MLPQRIYRLPRRAKLPDGGLSRQPLAVPVGMKAVAKTALRHFSSFTPFPESAPVSRNCQIGAMPLFYHRLCQKQLKVIRFKPLFFSQPVPTHLPSASTGCPLPDRRYVYQKSALPIPPCGKGKALVSRRFRAICTADPAGQSRFRTGTDTRSFRYRHCPDKTDAPARHHPEIHTDARTRTDSSSPVGRRAKTAR